MEEKGQEQREGKRKRRKEKKVRVKFGMNRHLHAKFHHVGERSRLCRTKNLKIVLQSKLNMDVGLCAARILSLSVIKRGKDKNKRRQRGKRGNGKRAKLGRWLCGRLAERYRPIRLECQLKDRLTG